MPSRMGQPWLLEQSSGCSSLSLRHDPTLPLVSEIERFATRGLARRPVELGEATTALQVSGGRSPVPRIPASGEKPESRREPQTMRLPSASPRPRGAGRKEGPLHNLVKWPSGDSTRPFYSPLRDQKDPTLRLERGGPSPYGDRRPV
jgi:hypothetical protein